MKKLLLLWLLFVSSCAPFYGNLEQYEKGEWHLFATPKQAARIEEDRMAFDRLKEQSVQTGPSSENDLVITRSDGKRAYKVIIANLSDWRRYSFVVIKGPGPGNQPSYLVPPGVKRVKYFTPGKYFLEVRYGSTVVGKKTLWVTNQVKEFMGEACHEYIYAEW